MRLTLLTLLTAISMAVFSQEPRVMTLQECVDLAVTNNLNVQRSKLNKDISEINLTQSRLSRLPTVNAGGNHVVNWGRGIDNNTNQFVNRRFSNTGLNAQSNVTIYGGMQTNNTIKQNQFNLRASQLDVEKAINDIQVNIITFYLNVIFNQELLQNARFQLESSQEQLGRTKILVEAGSLPKSNELEIVSQVSSNEVNVINAENSLNFAMLTLKQEMLLPTSDLIDVVMPDVEIEQLDLGGTPDKLFLNAESTQPEIQSADIRVRSAEYGYKVAQGGLLPTLSATVGVNTNYSDFIKERFVSDGTFTVVEDPLGNPVTSQTFFQTQSGEAVDQLQVLPGGDFEPFGVREQFKENYAQFAAINLSIPVFNGYSARSSIQRSKIGIYQAKINATEQRNFLRQTIETAHNDAQSAAKTYGAASRQVEALEETFRSIENQYNFGASNFTDYQVASNNLFQAKSDQTRAKFDFIFKKKLLDFYQGKPIF